MTSYQRTFSSIGLAIVAALITYPLYNGSVAYGVASVVAIVIGLSAYYVMQQRQLSTAENIEKQQQQFTSLEESIEKVQESNRQSVVEQLESQRVNLQQQMSQQKEQWLKGQEGYEKKLSLVMKDLNKQFTDTSQKMTISVTEQNQKTTKVMELVAKSSSKQVTIIDDLKDTLVKQQAGLVENWQVKLQQFNDKQIAHINGWISVTESMENKLTGFLNDQEEYNGYQIEHVNRWSETTLQLASQLSTFITNQEAYAENKRTEERIASEQQSATSQQQLTAFLTKQEEQQGKQTVTLQEIYQKQLEAFLQKVSMEMDDTTDRYNDVINQLQSEYKVQATDIATYQKLALGQSQKIVDDLKQYEVNSTRSQQEQRDAVIEQFQKALTEMTGTLKQLQLSEWKETTKNVTAQWNKLTEKTVSQFEVTALKTDQQHEHLFKEIEKQTGNIHKSQAEIVRQQEEQLDLFNAQRKEEQAHINKQLDEQLSVFVKAQDSYDLLTESSNEHHAKLQQLAERITNQQDTVSNSYQSFKEELISVLKHNELAVQQVSVTLDASVQLAQDQFKQQTESLTTIVGAIGEEIQSTSDKMLASRNEEVRELQNEHRKSERSRKTIEKDVKRLTEDVSTDVHSIEQLQKMIKEDNTITAEQFKQLTTTFQAQVLHLERVVQLMSSNYEEMTKLNQDDLKFLGKLMK